MARESCNENDCESGGDGIVTRSDHEARSEQEYGMNSEDSGSRCQEKGSDNFT
jgi:hypothetical protein